MRIYIAGGISGNLNPAWKRMATREISLKGFEEALKSEGFLAGRETRHHVQYDVHGNSLVKEKAVRYKQEHENIHGREHDISKIHRSDTIRGGFDKEVRDHKPYILESFYYTDEDTERLIPYFGDFLLDSGAFTFMQDNSLHPDWDDYIERYAAFIRRNNVEKFFELDIDTVVGYEKVKEYRKKLENLTGRQVIPVWHKNRGIEEFKKMCQEYPYVAIGATAKNEDSRWTKKNPEILNYFITTAHKHGCKIHGLGFTRIGMLDKFHFDSVDSTAWTAGNRFGFIYRFDGKTMQKIQCPKGKRLGKPREVALINYVEWIKFQKYADSNL